MTDDNIIGYEAMEFCGKGDPMFGGNADDRPLGLDGQFMRRYVHHQIARFQTREAAQAAADFATKRPGARVGIIPVRDWSRR
jgi:hypothetical protein